MRRELESIRVSGLQRDFAGVDDSLLCSARFFGQVVSVVRARFDALRRYNEGRRNEFTGIIEQDGPWYASGRVNPRLLMPSSPSRDGSMRPPLPKSATLICPPMGVIAIGTLAGFRSFMQHSHLVSGRYRVGDLQQYLQPALERDLLLTTLALSPFGQVRPAVFALQIIRRCGEIPFEQAHEILPLAQRFLEKAGQRDLSLETLKRTPPERI